MSNKNPTPEFQTRIQQFSETFDSLNKRHQTLSVLRVIMFVSFLVLVVYAANIRSGYLLTGVLIVFTTAFGFIISIHNKLKFSRDTTKHLIRINEEEVLRLGGGLSKLYDGHHYEDKNHFFAPDLDIFGSNSLFQLLVRSRQEKSRDLAASWLLQHAPPKEISERHEAVRELSKKTEWRQHFTALGMHNEQNEKANNDGFMAWLKDDNSFLGKTLWEILSYLMPALSLCLTVLILAFDYPYQLIFIPILTNLFFLKVIFDPLLKITKEFDAATKTLKSYEKLINSVENTVFESKKLLELQSVFTDQNRSASTAVRSLRRILLQLFNRANMLYFPLNMVFLLDLIWLLKAEKWRKSYGHQVENWFDAIHEIDVLNDMASLSYANPDFVFPTVANEPYSLKALQLGHPLIPVSERITNDFTLSGRGKSGLITGSNMSGKSTFLRTVGINLVMAQSGLPVCAASYTYSPMMVFSSMRTQDNLEEHISSFYAELSRIKLLLDSIGDKPIFYLLDEILKGTNSEDRHKGSLSLVSQLTHKNCMGLVTTHDLSLANMENDLVTNYSFNSNIVGDEIIFDYKLTPGPCKSFNASKLMEKMGIIVEEGRE